MAAVHGAEIRVVLLVRASKSGLTYDELLKQYGGNFHRDLLNSEILKAMKRGLVDIRAGRLVPSTS